MRTKTIIAAFAASAAVFTGCLKNETVPMEHPATSKLTVNVSCDIDSKAAGINAHSYVSEGTAHEFLTWRRSLREMAPRLFK